MRPRVDPRERAPREAAAIAAKHGAKPSRVTRQLVTLAYLRAEAPGWTWRPSHLRALGWAYIGHLRGDDHVRVARYDDGWTVECLLTGRWTLLADWLREHGGAA